MKAVNRLMQISLGNIAAFQSGEIVNRVRSSN